MMAYDMAPDQTTYSPTSTRKARPSQLRQALVAAALMVAALTGLGAGSAALADPGHTVPQHEQLQHARTGCLTPDCPR